MMSTKQKWVLGGLVVVSAGIWTPQVVARIAPDTSAQIAMSDGPDESEMLSIETQAAGGGSAPGQVASVGRQLPSTMGQGRGTPSASDSSQGSTGQVSTEAPIAGPDALVGQVLRALGGAEVFGVAEEATEIAASVDPTIAIDDVPEVNLESTLLNFVADNPLRGTIAGESVAVALIGDHRVRLGDIVPGTQATVTKIERGRVTLEENGIAVDLALAPLRTSAASMRKKAAQQMRLAAGSQGGDGLEIPGSSDSLPGGDRPVSKEPKAPESSESLSGDTPLDEPQGQGDF